MVDHYIIPRIRNVRQLRNLCGPAALATVLGYWGIDASLEEIAADTFHPAVQATHVSDLVRFCTGRGVNARMYRGNLPDLKRRVADNVPMVVLQMSRWPAGSAHYRVVIGYDDDLQSLIVLDPDRPGVWRILYHEFTRLWRPCGRCTLLVKP
jgi:predicted double-glycine peptidase